MKILISILFSLSLSTVYAKETKITVHKKTENKTEGRVFFSNLKDGEEIPSTFQVQFGLEGMALRNAGEDVMDKATGHHHVLINKEAIPEGQPIPMDEQHLHFGKSQTEGELNLKPGKYTLTLQLADGAHRSYGKKWSSTIKITVKK